MADRKPENQNFGPFLIFLWLYIATQMKQCISILVILVSSRHSFRYCKMQILWSFAPWTPTSALPGPAAGLTATPAVLCNDLWSLHFLSSSIHTFQTKKQKNNKTSTTGGAIDKAASPAASLSPRHDHWYLTYTDLNNKQIFLWPPRSNFSLDYW